LDIDSRQFGHVVVARVDASATMRSSATRLSKSAELEALLV
jgi:hypothetical protein